MYREYADATPAASHAGKGFGSLALRVAPLAVALLAFSAGGSRDGQVGAAALLIVGGAITAVAVDAAVLAREDATPEKASRLPITVTPQLFLTKARVTAELGASF